MLRKKVVKIVGEIRETAYEFANRASAEGKSYDKLQQEVFRIDSGEKEEFDITLRGVKLIRNTIGTKMKDFDRDNL